MYMFKESSWRHTSVLQHHIRLKLQGWIAVYVTLEVSMTPLDCDIFNQSEY
jgi:hypothetical protein